MNVNTSASRSSLSFFLIVFVLSIPIWLVGGNKLPLPVNLPVSALTTFVPGIAAFILVYRHGGLNSVRELFKRTLDFRRIRNKIWYLPTLLLAPVLYVLSFIIMRLTRMPLPAQLDIPLQMLPVFFVMYFIADAGEELGWTAYATDPMQERWGAFRGSLLLGVVWALWHSIAFVQTGNSISWVLWQSLKTVAMRIIIIWIYNNTGKSVFATILYHTSDNISWSLFPNLGSHYKPAVTASLSWIAVLIAVFVWGAKTLSHYRGSRRNFTATR